MWGWGDVGGYGVKYGRWECVSVWSNTGGKGMDMERGDGALQMYPAGVIPPLG